jgi:hypothetical protein
VRCSVTSCEARIVSVGGCPRSAHRRSTHWGLEPPIVNAVGTPPTKTDRAWSNPALFGDQSRCAGALSEGRRPSAGSGCARRVAPTLASGTPSCWRASADALDSGSLPAVTAPLLNTRDGAKDGEASQPRRPGLGAALRRRQSQPPPPSPAHPCDAPHLRVALPTLSSASPRAAENFVPVPARIAVFDKDGTLHDPRIVDITVTRH